MADTKYAVGPAGEEMVALGVLPGRDDSHANGISAGRLDDRAREVLGRLRRRTGGRLVLFSLGLLIGLASRVENAKAVGERLLITDINSGSVVFDQTTSESDPDSETILFNTNAAGPALAIVVLTEPGSEPPDPREPPVFMPGTNIPVSDVVVSNGDPANPVGRFGGFAVGFVSDGDPVFDFVVAHLPDNCGTACPTLEETGDLQDLTALLQADLFGLRVQVQSDVVPEPGTLALMTFGIVGLGALRRARADH